MVDNASTDATAELVRTHFPLVTLLQNATNVGFARANNRALAQASGEYLLLLNPDTVVEPNALSILCAYLAEHPRVGAVGPRLVRPDGSVQRSCLRYVTLRALLSGFVQGGDYLPADPRAPATVEALSGAALMVRRAVMDEVGLLDEAFFMYAEDTDWCYRIRPSRLGNSLLSGCVSPAYGRPERESNSCGDLRASARGATAIYAQAWAGVASV